MTELLRTRVLSQFTCLGDKCEDTCCQGWSMQVDDATYNRYSKEASELLDAVESAKEAPHIMRKNASGFCVKFDGGLCGIHKEKGDRFLGDACHFYPRVTRKLGDQVLMTATMSCPEITRLALSTDDALGMDSAAIDRLPESLRDYLPEGLSPADALAVHKAFVDAASDKSAGVEQIFLRIASVARSLELVDRKSWPSAVVFYLKHADGRIPPAEINLPDPFNLAHALCGLIVTVHKIPSPRLLTTLDEMEKALAFSLDWQNVQIKTTDESLPSYQRVRALWQQEGAARYADVLRRWLQMQLSLTLFPYAGQGASLSERITLIGVRLATIKLALMCSCSIHGTVLPQDVVIRILQSLSRFMDHLGDPSFSLRIYKETGWIQEARMRGLLEI